MLNTDTGYEFVDLKRTFHELSKSSSDDDADFRQGFLVGERLSWADLTKEYRLVLLSEAGSGKTAEIRNIARSLRTEGKAAFFLRLEHIPNHFEDAFEVGDMKAFQKWLASGEESWLLLDSVDESRLRHPGDFDLAIRIISRRIMAAIDRAHIVITSRTTAWRPKTDLALCVRYLPFSPTATTVSDETRTDDIDQSIEIQTLREGNSAGAKEKSIFTIVALDDLSPGQIESFAAARGVADTKSLIEAIERADAWSFTARPQDLDELIGFWIDQGRIGGRLEILRNSISRRLTERDQGRADARPLSAERARQGAKLAAAVATLTQEPTIRVPDGTNNTAGTAIQTILPDWDDKDQAAVLSRPIFDEAIYGSVRFHHRSVREYLTAEWFADLLNRETSRQKIEALFFRDQYGLEVVIPTMRPILPWLSILDEKIRERVRKVAPEVILEGGDPSQLPLSTRTFILDEVCEQLASGTSGGSIADYAAVQRFANIDLTDEVRNLLTKYADNDELTGFLLRMVWLGQLKGALPEAKAIALKSSVSTYTRIAAFRAVKALGSQADREDISSSFGSEASELRREWLAELVEEIEATPQTLAWLASCLEKAAPKKRYSVDALMEAVTEFAQTADLELMANFMSRLRTLLDQPPLVERRYCEVSQKFMWLMNPAMTAVERLIEARHPAAISCDTLEILHKLGVAREYGDPELRKIKSDVADLIPAWPELNKALFWFDVAKARQTIDKKPGERLTDFLLVSLFRPLWRFATADFEDVISLIHSRPEQDDKMIALSLAFSLYVQSGRPAAWRKQLKDAAGGDLELSNQLKTYLKPAPQTTEVRAWRRREAAWKQRTAAREKKEQKTRTEWKDYIARNVELIRDPKLSNPTDISRAQWYLHEKIRDKQSRSGRWTSGNWKEIAKEFGEAAALAYRDSAIVYWRRYRPMLLSEGSPPNSTPYSIIFGLSGLEIEANEAPDWPRGLGESEVELACRYASHELNGFPTWFPRLFQIHSKAVTEFLLREIRYELSIEKRDEETHYILSDVSWSGEWSWNAIGPEIYAYLQSNEPQSYFNLTKLLTIVQGSLMTNEELSKLAGSKIASFLEPLHAAHWFAVWVGVDPKKAIPSLKAYLAKGLTAQESTSLAMNFVASLLGGGRRTQSSRVRGAFQTPQHLKSLYLLMHEHIRQRDDVDRSGGGVYSPELRDDAQEARNRLFDLLSKIPGKEAYLALQEISKSHPEESARSHFVYHAKRKAERDADLTPWSASQVRDFNDKLERTPTNHRDLADLAVMRFTDIKDDLEHGDSSVAGLMKAVSLETDIRKYIGRELREKAYGRYAIPQEEELADAKKPDLRFHGMGFDGPVPVELKLADKWTGPGLFERLENQLCSDYLRDSRSTRGLFILVNRGEKAGWDVPNEGNRVDFAGLVAALQSHWARISSKFSGVDEITVIGIDLTKRRMRPSPLASA